VSQKNKNATVRRILVPLDASSHSMSALDIAAELASYFNAELMGLFVEDINLLRLAESPFAQEISFFSPVFRRLDREHLKLQLRIQAERMRAALVSRAARADVPWSFRVTRGGVPTEVLAAAAEADMTIMGKVGMSLIQAAQTGSTVRSIIARSRGMTLILQQGFRLESPIMTVYSGSDLSQRALRISSDLQKMRMRPMTVFIPAGDKAEFDRLRDEAEALLKQYEVEGVFRILDEERISRLSRTLNLAGLHLLVLPCEEPYFCGDAVQSLVDRLSNPVLLIR